MQFGRSPIINYTSFYNVCLIRKSRAQDIYTAMFPRRKRWNDSIKGFIKSTRRTRFYILLYCDE